MKDLFTIKIKNKEYVHIDTIKYKEQIIYHFASLEEELFCIKEENEYNPIQDAFQLAIIKNKLGLISTKHVFDVKQDVYRIMDKMALDIDYYMKRFDRIMRYGQVDIKIVEDNEKYKVIQEQIGNFSEIREKFNIDLKLEEIAKIIRNVKLIKKDILLKGRASGYYSPRYNMVALKDENDIDKGDKKDKRTRLHEYIHSITGKKCILYDLLYMGGLLEGETENLVEDYIGSKNSSFYYDEKNKDKASIQFDFSRDTTYKPLVSIVRQMEYSIGNKSHNSILNGNIEFEEEFAKKYGRPLMIFLAYRTKMLLAGRRLNRRLKNIKPFDEIKYFKNTQDILMKRVFDKDFESIETIDDAKIYLQRLRDFENLRGRIRYKDEISGEQREDTGFKDYYNKKYKDIVENFKNKGFEKDEVDSNLEKYKYKRQIFKPFRKENEEIEFVKNIIISDIAEECIRNNSMNININDLKFNYFRILEDSYSILVKDNVTNDRLELLSANSCEEEQALEIVNKTSSKGKVTSEELEQYLKKAGYEEQEVQFTEEEFKERIFAKFRRIEDSLYKKIFYTSMYEEPSEVQSEKIKRMQQEHITIRHLLTLEHEREDKTKVRKTKVDRAKELINLSKEQDKEIQQLESQVIEKGISRNE
ncbi:MAG: hypothetical protein IJH39_00970 [Clostridia bacterium]|nr:hypothetical protein [Clostridia bacterium]